MFQGLEEKPLILLEKELVSAEPELECTDLSEDVFNLQPVVMMEWFHQCCWACRGNFCLPGAP